MLASTTLDVYAVADAILTDYQSGDAGATEHEYSEDKDVLVADDADNLESVSEEVEEGLRVRRVVQYDQ